MKLRCAMEKLDIDGELMAVPIDTADYFHGVLRVNETTADVLAELEHETTEDEIVAALAAKYDGTDEQIRASVRKVVDVLAAEGLLE